MKSTTTSHHADTQTLCEAMAKAVSKETGVTVGKMFGASALTIKGKVCAIFAHGTLMVKLPQDRVAGVVASKKRSPGIS